MSDWFYVKFKIYCWASINERIKTKLNRILRREFNENEIDIFASSYDVQIYLLFAKLLIPSRSTIVELTRGTKFLNGSRYDDSTFFRSTKNSYEKVFNLKQIFAYIAEEIIVSEEIMCIRENYVYQRKLTMFFLLSIWCNVIFSNFLISLLNFELSKNCWKLRVLIVFWFEKKNQLFFRSTVPILLFDLLSFRSSVF